MQKEGCAVFAPAEAYFTRIENGTVTICAPTHSIVTRGDTLGGINLTLKISAPMPEVIRVQTCHFAGAQKKEPHFAIASDPEYRPQISEDEEQVTVTSGSLSLTVDKKNWKMTYTRNGEKLTQSTGRDLAYVKTEWKGDYYDRITPDNTFMRQQLSLAVDEKVYGMGERFTSFIKNGQSVDIWNEDGGTSTEQSYKNIPFYLTNRGYGVFVNHPERVAF